MYSTLLSCIGIYKYIYNIRLAKNQSLKDNKYVVFSYICGFVIRNCTIFKKKKRKSTLFVTKKKKKNK